MERKILPRMKAEPGFYGPVPEFARKKAGNKKLSADQARL